MGLFDWLFTRPSFYRFEDSFALERARLWAAIGNAVEECQQQDKIVLLICHFPETFEMLQGKLEQWQVSYGIPTREIDQNWFRQRSDEVEQVQLVMAQLLQPPMPRPSTGAETQSMAMIVCERHPLISRDQRVEEFARHAPLSTRLGYFLALDDAVVEECISPNSIELLKQMGMGNRDLITSRMVTRRLNVVLKRRRATSDISAVSAVEWYSLNGSEKI